MINKNNVIHVVELGTVNCHLRQPLW